MYGSFSPQRKPCIERLIKEIKPTDERIATYGILSDKNSKNLTARLSDEGKSIDLAFANEEQFNSANEKDFYRVCGTMVYNSNPPTINVETIHKIESFDKTLWRKIRNAEIIAYYD